MSFFSLFSRSKTQDQPQQKFGNAYDFEFQNLENDSTLKLSDFKGQVVMLVNTASQCGFAGQYGELQELYAKYHEKGFVVIGVPSNDFGGQESGTPQEIASFCGTTYGVTFPLTCKTEVTGEKSHPFYVWAKEKLGFGTAPKWNFHKYVINCNGELVDYFNTTTPPDAPRVIALVEKLLEESKAS